MGILKNLEKQLYFEQVKTEYNREVGEGKLAPEKLVWFGLILDLHPVPKPHLGFSIHYNQILITHSVLRVVLSLEHTPPYKL